MNNYKIIWTKIDEAPELASYCLLPIVKAYFKGSNIEVETKDISLAGRVIANFPDNLTDEQKIPDFLTEMGEIVKQSDANVIKLPNISASIPQLQATIKELQSQGYDIPDYPEEPRNEEEKKLQERFSKALGSAVNPVLREGNSDRRPATSVKKFAQKKPHRMMKPWNPAGMKTKVIHMTEKDFYGTEKSVTMDKPTNIRIEYVGKDGNVKILKEKLSLLEGEVIDSSVMNVAALRKFYAEAIEEARKDNLLLSLHLKATMMKISDPIMFGHAVEVYYKEALDKHSDSLKQIGANVNNGLQDILDKLDRLPEDKKNEILADINKCHENQPDLAMVDSRYGITNLHVPNNIIIDASMPVVVRDGGQMWDKNDQLRDTVCAIPDRSYSTMYQEIIEDCKRNGQFDPATMGNVSNVGLMAQKAEEYGSHDKTFEAEGDGVIRVVDFDGNLLMEQNVEKGDIFRMCQTKDIAIRDWVKLAARRVQATGNPAYFWLDKNRAHDREIIKKVNKYLPEHDTPGMDLKILKPQDAIRLSCDRVRQGLDVISVTGNVLRDYLTDLFPILELGTSARMLSVVPLLAGGGLFETGAGGSAPKHVQQFLKEGHLRWDSLGEYCALIPSLELIYEKTQDPKVAVYIETLDKAVEMYLENGKLPSRKVKEIDNRGSSFYLAMYWAQTLAAQDNDLDLKAKFAPIAKQLTENELKINEELLAAQGSPVDIGGYYHSNEEMTTKAMRPSPTFNAIIDSI